MDHPGRFLALRPHLRSILKAHGPSRSIFSSVDLIEVDFRRLMEHPRSILSFRPH